MDRLNRVYKTSVKKIGSETESNLIESSIKSGFEKTKNRVLVKNQVFKKSGHKNAITNMPIQKMGSKKKKPAPKTRHITQKCTHTNIHAHNYISDDFIFLRN